MGRQVTGHEIHIVRQILPSAGNAFDLRLAAQFSFGADFTRDARDFRSEGAKLIDHGVDGIFEFEEFAADVHGDFLGQVAIGNRRGYGGNVADLGSQV